VSEWFFTSDLHGQGALYEQVVALVAAHRPAVLLLGGDLAPHESGAEGVRRQRVFLQGFFVEFARRVREAARGLELLVLMGNDDWSANHDVLESQEGRLWRVLHGRVAVVDGVRVAGSSWVPITPFGMKDWERWEDGEPESPARLDGWVSHSGGITPVRFDPDRRTPTIAEALGELSGLAGPEALYVLHSPPRDTRCDMVGARVHVGSRAIRAFVERLQPPLVLSGHIHESPRVSGRYRDSIGRTVVVNPGQFGTVRLCGVWFDPRRGADSLRHTVFG
jgi:Icc-related predicted phosphoesterase